MVKCLVTGAGGFIGTYVMAAHQLFRNQFGASLVAAPADLDIRDVVGLRAQIREHAPDFVIHLAAKTYVPDTVADPLATYEVNLLGTLNLLTALTEWGFKGTMLFVSSAEVYGRVAETGLPILESHHFAPRTPYAVSKSAAELACVQYAMHGFDVRIARPFNVIGAGQSSKFAVSSFARQIAMLEKQGGGEIAVGNLDVSRDFIAVQDVVKGFASILAKGHAGDAYNVCSGVETVLQDLLLQLLALSTVTVRVRSDPERVRPAEQRRVVGSYGKLNAIAGWKPGIDLAGTLREVIGDWRTRPD